MRLPSPLTCLSFVVGKGSRGCDTRLAARARRLLAGLAVGSSGHGVFRAGLDFRGEGRVMFSNSFQQSWIFLPLPALRSRKGKATQGAGRVLALPQLFGNENFSLWDPEALKTG